MRKNLLLMLCFTLSIVYARGQSFYDNFDSYTPGNYLGSSSSKWTTWSGTSGGSDDVKVTNTDAFSGANSIYLNSTSTSGGPSDVVLKFGGEHTKGQFMYSAMMKIPAKKGAYFNFQAYTKVGTSGGWALDAYFYSNGTFALQNGSTNVLTGTYPQGAWFQLKFNINLTANKWEFLIDNVSKGSFSNGFNQIAAIDIYPVNDTSSFWVDDVSYVYFKPSPDDAGIYSIDSPAVYCANATRNIYATVGNFGNNQIKKVTVNWSINGKTKTPVIYSSTLDSFNGSGITKAKVKLGSYTFGNTADTIKVWSSLPNGNKDTVPFTDTVVIIKKPTTPPLANAGDDQAICSGTTVKIGTTGVPGHKYSWTSDPPGFTSVSFNPNVTPTVSTTYKLVIYNTASGCTGEDSVFIQVKPVPSAVLDSAKTICKEDSVQIGPTPDANLIYSWSSTPAGFSSTIANPYVKPSVTTTYKLTIMDTGGCSITYPVEVKVNPLPVAVAGVDKVVCKGTTVLLGRSANANETYSWRSIPAGFTSTQSNPTLIPKNDTTVYILRVTNPTGCFSEDEVTVVVTSPPVANAGADTTICIGKSIKIGSNFENGVSYSWSSRPSGFVDYSASVTVSPKVTTTYKVTARNSNNCTSQDSVTITVVPLPTVNPGSNKRICMGETVTLGPTAVNGMTYSWTSTPAGFTSTDAQISVSPTENTTYNVVASNQYGCTANGQVTVTIKPSPTAKAGTDKDICPGAPIQIGETPLSNLTYSWTSIPAGFTSTSANPTVNPTTTTTYKLMVTDTSGCKAEDEVIVVVAMPTADFTVPSTSLNATFKATTASFLKYEWKFGDGNTDTGRVVSHTYPQAAQYKVRLTVYKTDSCSITKDSFVTIGTVGINQPEKPVSDISIYPNPFTSSTTLSYTLFKRAQVNIILTDITGKQVAELVNKVQANGDYKQEINADTYKLKPGIYFIQMQEEGAGTTRKIMKLE